MFATERVGAVGSEDPVVERIAVAGLVLAFAGLWWSASGVGRTATAVGAALTLGASAFLLTPGGDRRKYAVAFVALLSAPLLAFGGVVRVVGGVGVVVVLAAVVGPRTARLRT